MTPSIIISVIAAYFSVIILISYLTSRNSSSKDFYSGGNKSPWWVVAVGMIGTTLSGVTFISVPGWVAGDAKMTYFAVVLGNLVGYLLISMVLLPLYYKMNLTSIYTYIEQRFGISSYKTSAVLFLVSKVIGAAFRMFIVALVLQTTVFNPLGISFEVNVFITIALIWLYTFKGGIKSIIWTDMIQTSCLVFAVIFTIFVIKSQLGFSFTDMFVAINDSSQSKIFDFSNFIGNKHNFIKQFIAGVFITIVMVGLDQDMMQKNLSLKNIKEAKKNFLSFAIAFVPVNFIFLCLGVLFVIYMNTKGIAMPLMENGTIAGDKIYTLLAMNHLGSATAIMFILGVIAAAFSSANSALIALTTSYMIDISPSADKSEKYRKNKRTLVHIGFSIIIALVIIFFNALNNDSVVSAIFKFAGYTYGPLLGLFTMGIFFKTKLKDKFVPIVCFVSPVVTYLLDMYSVEIFSGYKFGFEVLILNGILSFIGLYLIRKR
jgi:SSS family transporter